MYLGVEDSTKAKILATYDSEWLAEFEYDILDFMPVTAFDMVDHLKDKCLKLTNTENKERLKET